MISREVYVSKNSKRLKKWGRVSQRAPCSSTKTKICYNLCFALLINLLKIDLQKRGTVEKLLVAFKNFFFKVILLLGLFPKNEQCTLVLQMGDLIFFI